MRKKWVSVLLALALALALLPAAAMAAGTECAGGEDCQHVAAINGMHYDTLQEAIDAAVTGDEIVLLKSTQEDGVTFAQSGSYTLNLGGNTLRSDKDNGDLIAITAPDLTLNIKGGTLLSEGATTYGIYSYTGASNLNLILEGVVIDTIDQPVGVQGLNSNQNVTVRNSSISCDTTGIYFPPISGTLRVENSQITAVDNGIVVKGGNVVVSGDQTVITATGTPEDQDKPYDGNVMGEGFPKTGNAIYVEGGYTVAGGGARPIDVQIQDGVFESASASALAMNFATDTNVQTMQVQGGVFSSDIQQFVAKDATSASLASESDTTYYVGDPALVSSRLGKAAVAGDAINVLAGSMSLSIASDGVTVTNSGTGTVSVNGQELGQDPVITHTHTWGEADWTWNEDNTAMATFTCQKDASHTQQVKAEVTSQTTAATCTADGQTVYTATVTFEGQIYTNEKIVVLPATGHGTTELKNAKAATCTEEGYTGDKVCTLCGQVVEQGTVIPKAAHSYQDGKCTVCGAADPNYKPAESTTNDQSNSPKTGDDSQVVLWTVLLVAACGGAAGLTVYGLRKKRQ